MARGATRAISAICSGVEVGGVPEWIRNGTPSSSPLRATASAAGEFAGKLVHQGAA